MPMPEVPQDEAAAEGRVSGLTGHEETIRLLRRIAPMPGERALAEAAAAAPANALGRPEAPDKARERPETPTEAPQRPKAPQNAPKRPETPRSAPKRPSEALADCEDKARFALDNPRQEAFCRGLARGLSVIAAAKAARYRKPRNCRKLARRPEIMARVDYLEREAAWEASSDIAGLFSQLRLVSAAALSGDAPRTLSVARDCVEIAARLKAQIPRPFMIDPDRVAPDDERELTPAEWQRKYGKPAPGEGA